MRSRAEIAAQIERRGRRASPSFASAQMRSTAHLLRCARRSAHPAGTAEHRLRATAAPSFSPTSNAQKIALFRSLFAGARMCSRAGGRIRKTGKSGYAPACRERSGKLGSVPQGNGAGPAVDPAETARARRSCQ